MPSRPYDERIKPKVTAVLPALPPRILEDSNDSRIFPTFELSLPHYDEQLCWCLSVTLFAVRKASFMYQKERCPLYSFTSCITVSSHYQNDQTCKLVCFHVTYVV
ncbi:unnamed protein product [Heterobilharzia americana]|nr:unnamed protein product [Heterobilharzia americana]